MVPNTPRVAAAAAAAKGIEERRAGPPEIKSLQEYHAGIKKQGG
jgi:hypothetical protein